MRGRCALACCAAILALPCLAAWPIAAFGQEEAASAPAVELKGTSTLAQWLDAPRADRARLAVEIARERLGPGATDLAVATAAMEITGCLSATAGDPRFTAWTVAPTAATCLSAPERASQ